MSLAPPESVRTLQKKLYIKAKENPQYRFYALYDKVYREDILAHAYRVCRVNGGAAGVDGETFEDIETSGREAWLLKRQEDVRNKTYKPNAVRRVMIPKAGGGERPLGIPTITDRVVQTAAKLVLEPIFEADFEDCAYGYRPERSGIDAVKAVHEALRSGYTDVVDADLSKYFDTIPHHDLLQSVARRVSDPHMLKLIKGWLKVPVEERDERGNRRMTGGKRAKLGTPQGGVISPLLANIYMHRYLRHWRQQGRGQAFRARIVNYADDFVILSRGYAVEAMAWTQRVMERLGLKLNTTKTRLVNAKTEPFDFLGYTFGPEVFRKTGAMYTAAQPSRKSCDRVKERVATLLSIRNPQLWEEVLAGLNQTLRGWAGYFHYGSTALAYREIDHYVVDRVWLLLRRRRRLRKRRHRFSPREVFGKLGVLSLRELAAAR